MAVPKLDTEQLAKTFNQVRMTGQLLTEELTIRRLKAQIAKLDDTASYHSYMGSLLCLQGDFKSARDHAWEVINKYDPSNLNSVVTLLASGFFSEARNIFDYYQSKELHLEVGNDPKISKLAYSTLSLGFIRDILIKHTTNKIEQTLEFTEDVLKILKNNSISENTLLEMLDFAGETLRSHNMFVPRQLRVIPNPSNNTINVSIPLLITPKELVEMEWEFLHSLHTKMPEAPSSTIHVGFTCAPPKNGD